MHLLQLRHHTTNCTPCYLLPPLPWLPTGTDGLWRGCVSGLSETEDQEGTRLRWRVTFLSESLCWPTGPHLHRDIQQITGAVLSPLLLQTLHYHPGPQETLHQPSWTEQARRPEVCGHEVFGETGVGPPGHHRPPAGTPSVYLPGKQVSGWCSQHGTALHPATPRLPKERMQGSCSWTSARRSAPSSQRSFSPNSPSSLWSSWHTGSSRWGWEKSHSTLVPFRDVCSPRCCSPSTPTTASQETCLFNCWNLQATQQSSTSSETEMSLHMTGGQTVGPVVRSKQPGAEHAQNCGDDSGLQEEALITAPFPHHTQQRCVSCGLQFSGIYNLPGPEVGVLPQELLVQFYTAVFESVLCTSTKQGRNRLQWTVCRNRLFIPFNRKELSEITIKLGSIQSQSVSKHVQY